MDLSECTDSQLIEELKRRQLNKVAESLDREKKKPYVFWRGVVVHRSSNSWGAVSNRFVFIVEDKEGRYKATLLGNIGFNQKNMPKLGDKVLLRYKQGFGYTCNKGHSKIIEIISC